MADLPGRRTLAIGAAVVVAAVGAGIAVALSGDDEESAPSPTTPAERTEATVPTNAPPTRSGTGRSNNLAREQEVQETVTLLVEASERGDADTVCRLIGEPLGGRSGLRALQACAAAANVNLEVLPTSDELSIERITASDDRGAARLVDGTTISLRRTKGNWRVVRITPPR